MRRILCGVLLPLLLAVPASAGTRHDPDDVQGKLDLEQVTRTFTHGPSSPPMIHLQATTYGRWTLRQCRRADACSFTFELDSRRGPGVDVVVFWDVDRSQPSCTVYNRASRLLAVGDAAKFRRSAFCSFRKRLLEQDKRVRWRVHSQWGVIVDNAPDEGWF